MIFVLAFGYVALAVMNLILQHDLQKQRNEIIFINRRLTEISNKRFLELAPEVERLKIVSLSLPPGSHEMDLSGCREIDRVSIVAVQLKPKEDYPCKEE